MNTKFLWTSFLGACFNISFHWNKDYKISKLKGTKRSLDASYPSIRICPSRILPQVDTILCKLLMENSLLFETKSFWTRGIVEEVFPFPSYLIKIVLICNTFNWVLFSSPMLFHLVLSSASIDLLIISVWTVLKVLIWP